MFAIQKVVIILILIVFSHYPSNATDEYIVKGQVITSDETEPLSFAQVAMYLKGNDLPAYGVISDETGYFKIRVKPGSYTMTIIFVGYEERKIDIEVVDQDINLGKVELKESVRQMEEVVVKGQKLRQPVKSTLEGLTVQPDQNISNLGGSLLDVLRNTPSVRVGDDGSVSIRGSNSTNILIDNRNSALTTDLEQIPASAIKSIEIINNPNARYDAAAAGGVINIKLKKGGQKGNTLRSEGTIGTAGRTNLNLRSSYKNESFNAYGGYSFRSWPDFEDNSTTREVFSKNELLEQFQDETQRDWEHTLNIGGDYFLGKNKISYEGVFNKEDEFQFQRNRSRLSNMSNNTIINQYIRDNNENEDNYTLDNALIYERLFNDSIKELRAVVSNSRRVGYETQDIDIYNGIFESNMIPDETTGMERSESDGLNATSIIQVDYIQSLWKGKMEAGYKSTFRKFDNDFTYERFDEATQSWQNQADVSNHFLYEDQIHAAYLIYTQKIANFNFSAGTRAEQTILNTTLFDTNEENSQSYLNFFPSLQLAYYLGENHTFKANYSRRIDRPSGWRLNPFPDVSDSLNVRIGNPNLQPEYINSFEAGHMFNKEVFSLTTNLFYRRVNNQVDWIVRVEDGISYRGPDNLNTLNAYGFELISTYEIFKWWQLNASYSFFGVNVDGTNLDNSFTNSGTSWYAKFTTDFLLPWDISLQFTGNYESPEIEAQGIDRERYEVDGSLQRSFFNEKAMLSVSLRDIFNTERFAGENYGEDFYQEFTYNDQSRILLVTMSYNFL